MLIIAADIATPYAMLLMPPCHYYADYFRFRFSGHFLLPFSFHFLRFSLMLTPRYCLAALMPPCHYADFRFSPRDDMSDRR